MKNNILLIVLAALSLVSCSGTKYVYFQDMLENEQYDITKMPPITIQAGDRLSIFVNSKSPELAIPFNIQSGLLQISESGDVTEAATSQTSTSTLVQGGYHVDQDGYINFPILGKIYVEGLTLEQISDTIKSKIIAGGYIKDPYVSAELINFKYTVLGAMGKGVFSSDNGDKVTILDAIAKSGDIAINGRLDNIMVIREENGSRVVYKMDIKTKDIFDSPAYYLQQNDIVYIEPKYRDRERYLKAQSYVSSTMSFIGSISTVVILMISLGIIGG